LMTEAGIGDRKDVAKLLQEAGRFWRYSPQQGGH
jgi:hypothetical protein